MGNKIIVVLKGQGEGIQPQIHQKSQLILPSKKRRRIGKQKQNNHSNGLLHFRSIYKAQFNGLNSSNLERIDPHYRPILWQKKKKG